MVLCAREEYYDRFGNAEQCYAGLQERRVEEDSRDRKSRCQVQGACHTMLVCPHITQVAGTQSPIISISPFVATQRGDVDFSQVMPLASGSRAKKMLLPESLRRVMTVALG